MAKFLSTTEFAEAIGVHPQTVRSWDETGKLKAHHRTLGNRRRYSEEQVEQVLHGRLIDDQLTENQD